MKSVLPKALQFLTQVAPTRIALRDGISTLNYAALPEKVAALARWLREHDCRVVALQLQNSIDWVLLDLACQAAETICLPLPDFFSSEQIRHCLTSAAVDWLITDSAAVAVPVRAAATALAPPSPSTSRPLFAQRLQAHAREAPWPAGTRKITFTSGSTGAPKGVCLDADLPWRVAQSLADVIAIPHVRHLCLLPLATLLENIAGVYAPLLCGGEVMLPDADARGLAGSSGLDLPAMLHCINAHQPNSLILLPQLLRALVAACGQGWRPPASLQFVAVGGARVAPELIGQARRVGLPVYEGYGLSECGSVVALNTPGRDQPGSVGRVLPHCRVDIDDGEIVVSGASHLGYLDDRTSWSQASAPVATGDLGALDGDDYLRVNGRRKNLLINGFGRNISPEWVESALGCGPLLTQCVVIGDARPHLSALLSTASGVSDDDIQRWIDDVNARLPDYARVRTWLRVDAETWPPLLTANGLPRREQINVVLGAAIDALYTDAAIDGLHPHFADSAHS